MDPTQHCPFGRTELQVPRLGFGTVPIAGLYQAVDEATAQMTLERAWELGVRLYDTAPLYGMGMGEQRLGRFLRPRPRDDYVLSTKVGRLLRSEPSPTPDSGATGFKGGPPLYPIFDFSYDGALRSFESSLERLGIDRVDILYIHDPDTAYAEAVNGAYRALERLRGEGVIGAIGVGMNQAEMLARFARDTDVDCFLVAGRYTLLDQIALNELLPLCTQKNIAVVIGGVYNSGILADPDAPGARFNYEPATEEWLDRTRRIKAVCERHGVPLKAAAIQFPFGHSAVAVVLTGVRSPAEIEENERMFGWAIPPALWSDLKGEGLLADSVPTPSS
jgi:D-threo-aldose 1-dehydrogenase